MRSEEDEAFDELARKQGAWGGGFQAKRAAAADKLQDGKCKYGCPACDARAQPAQEPEMLTIVYQNGYYDGKKAAQRPWVGFTDQESIDIIKQNNNYLYPIKLLQAVMDALKEKNT